MRQGLRAWPLAIDTGRSSRQSKSCLARCEVAAAAVASIHRDVWLGQARAMQAGGSVDRLRASQLGDSKLSRAVQ